MKKFPTAISVVAVALIDPAGRVLMQRRRRDRAHAGLWEFPGGKVEPAETEESALVRELEEELGIAVTGDALAYLSEAADPQSGIVIKLYTCRLWRGDPAALDAEALLWCEPAQLAGLAMPPLDVPLAEAVKELLASAK